MFSLIRGVRSSCIIIKGIRHLATGVPAQPEGGEGEEEFQGPIPRDKVSIACVKGSGPGGQNVNKLSTKVVLRFNVDQADWISDRIKSRLHQLFKTRINKSGDFILTSHKYRTQLGNMNDAFQKLETFVKEASEVPKGPSQLTRDRVQLLKQKSEWKRLRDKKYHSTRKQYRRMD